ncbi:MAG: major facilitator superfamily protein [Rhodospirillales bacterium]|nr:major facilitator superfamily protein [Rhodospirillales bacterium]
MTDVVVVSYDAIADHAGGESYETIVARIERLPVSGWHRFVRVVLGTCTFFDAYDAVAIAFVLPVLIGMWHLTPGEIGLLLSSGFVGQFFGSACFGWVGERYGRIFALNLTILIISAFGLACAFAGSYSALVVFRFIQGLGIGGEIPVAATYINEIAKTHRRGRFVLLYQIIYPVGFLAASLGSVWIVPHLGWQWIFVIGALPALLMIVIQRAVPESPRWLARHGRLREADTILTRLEKKIFGSTTPPPLGAVPPSLVAPPAARIAELFQGIYRRRTFCVWVMWFCSSMIGYGLLVWLPSLFTTVYHMSVQDSLRYSVLGNTGGLFVGIVAALVIDRLGRKPVFILSFVLGGLPLFALWALNQPSAMTVMLLAAIASACVAAAQLSLWTYTPEIYPTRMRALGTGAASSWARAGSMIGPPLVGWLLATTHQVDLIFLVFATAGFIGALVVLIFGTETSGKALEEISP